MHLYSMYTGFSDISLAASLLSISYTCNEEGFSSALNQASNTIAYMALPNMISYVAPQLAIAYTVGLTAYTAYSAVSNAFNLYNEMSGIKHNIDSLHAYKDIAERLHHATGLEFFGAKTNEYNTKINLLPGALVIDENDTE